jgi:hypothetical protein
MSFQTLTLRFGRAAIALGLALALSTVVSASAQPSPADDPEANYVEDLVVVAPTTGPAWWKVSKGSTVVWIMAMPPSNVPETLAWDVSGVRRRLRGAKVLLLPPEGRSRFEGRWDEALPDLVAEEMYTSARELGVRPQRYFPVTLPAVFALREYYFRASRLGLPIESQLIAEARRRRIVAERPPSMDVALTADMARADDPEIQTCALAMLKEVKTDPQTFRDTAALWARGRIAEVIATPRSAWTYCINRILPGYSRRAIESQTVAISRALDRRRKAVAVVPLRLLVAEDGVLQRLKARGYVVADPSRPLTN